MLTKEILILLPSFTEFPCSFDPNIWMFDTGNGVDMYFDPNTSHCTLVTCNSHGRGNSILFKGKIENIEQLVFILNSVKAYNPIYDYRYLLTPKYRMNAEKIEDSLSSINLDREILRDIVKIIEKDFVIVDKRLDNV